jgi:GMP synthase (glutamine-hydrolysing)
MIKNAFVIRHVGEERLGSYREVFEEDGITYHYIDAAHDDLESQAFDADLLVIMGGPIGVYDCDYYPFLKSEMKILEKRIAQDKPTLGVCLGAQLIAASLGAKVYKGSSGDELGWHPIEVNERGMKTPVRHLDAAHTSMFHWHGDTFDLPKGAELLASNAQYQHQAFSYGKNILGLQCHAEVTERMLREWFILFVRQVVGPNKVMDLHELRQQTAANAPVMKEQAKKFFREWIREREV